MPWTSTPHQCLTWTTCKHPQKDFHNPVRYRSKSNQKDDSHVPKWNARHINAKQGRAANISKMSFLTKSFTVQNPTNKTIIQTLKWSAVRPPLIQDYFKIISRFRSLKSCNKSVQKCTPWNYPVTFWSRFAASNFHALLNTILNLKNQVKKHSKNVSQNEVPWRSKPHQYLEWVTPKRLENGFPGKITKSMKKRQKQRSMRTCFRHKKHFHLKSSLDTQKSTIHQNRPCGRHLKWGQKWRQKKHQKSIKKHYPKSSSLKSFEFHHWQQTGTSTEQPRHPHLFHDISRFEVRLECTHAAFQATSFPAGRPTGWPPTTF